ncbi:hypothetical protein [Sediminicurvatus halobius]|uniref:DUF2214 domain-containing protein n=1 Tax=Sediminicurvatus halobius TaxID=2182432 RepID=A0A2U2N8K1_9GAMM|nr:hypothetical protein [Spiribacter halobius]PWG65403.1 hypothetical protein DEM34_01275 [Spiribacter halobius]UEX76422.1 DUF2214 domain-containing protein [Spiribacter halobius]
MELLAALEGSPLATALRQSVWAYPLVNAAHILGFALLVGAIVPLDLRLLGVWATEPAEGLARVLVPVAASGLLLAAIAGLLLFCARATEYAASPWFLGKMGLVGVGVANALAWRLRARRATPTARARLPGRTTAAVSLAGWLLTLLLGRLVGYF